MPDVETYQAGHKHPEDTKVQGASPSWPNPGKTPAESPGKAITAAGEKDQQEPG